MLATPLQALRTSPTARYADATAVGGEEATIRIQPPQNDSFLITFCPGGSLRVYLTGPYRNHTNRFAHLIFADVLKNA